MLSRDLHALASDKKFCTLTLLAFLSILSFHTVVGMRDAIVYSIDNGASIVPFVRTYITLPTTFLIGALYLLLQKRLGTALTYSLVNWGLGSYFVIYTLILTPYYSDWTISAEYAQLLRSNYPHFQHIINLVAHWPSALFHVCAEVWSVYIFIILYWQVANEATTKEEAARYYPIIIFLMSFGTTMAAYPIHYMSKATNPGLALLSIIVPISLTLSSIVFYINRKWALDQKTVPLDHAPKEESVSLMSRIRKALSQGISERVLYVSLSVMIFNLMMSLFDSCFWTRVSESASGQNEVLAFYSQYTFYKGCASLVAGMVNIYLINRMGWYFVLRITPIVSGLAINTMLFSYFPNNPIQLPETLTLMNSTYQMTHLITWVFALGLLVSYACKFAFFDPAKEIMIKEMSSEDRRVAKVFADGFSGRAGKITGGVLQSLLLSFTAAQSVLEIAPLIFVVSIVASFIYMLAIYRLRPRDDEGLDPAHAVG